MVSRNRAWADLRLNGDALVVGTPITVDLLAVAPTVDTLTAVRIVGDITVSVLVGSTVVDSLSVVDLGIGVSSLEAFTVAGTSLPNPADAFDYPPRGWLYVATQPVRQQAESTGVIVQVARFVFDIRSMRKIDKGKLFMTIVNSTITVGGAMEAVGRVRTLCLT